MARATSGLGQFRGKVGSVVFRVSQGQQIASAYQPAVRNPKSNLQTAQRNKMYLASQLSKLVPREDLVGLAPTASVGDRRSMFIREVIDNIKSTLDGDVFTSSIDFDNVKFSNGTDVSDGISVKGDDHEMVMTIYKNFISKEEYDRLAFKSIQIDVRSDGYMQYKSAWLDLVPYDEDTQTTSFTNTYSISSMPGMSTVVYLVPVRLSDNVRYSREKKTLIQIGEVGDQEYGFAIKGVYQINAAVLKWYKSLVGFNTKGAEIYPPSTDGDEVVNPDGPNFPNLG